MARKPVSYLAGAAVLGTAIGAVAAFLATSKHGPELKKSFRQRATEASHFIEDAGRAIPQKLARLPVKGREALERVPQLLSRASGAPVERGNVTVTVDAPHAVQEQKEAGPTNAG